MLKIVGTNLDQRIGVHDFLVALLGALFIGHVGELGAASLTKLPGYVQCTELNVLRFRCLNTAELYKGHAMNPAHTHIHTHIHAS